MKDRLVEQTIRKLKNRSGETITETLVALLISALAITMLAGVIAASSRIITNSRTKLNQYYDACNAMVDTSGGTSEQNVTITIPKPTGEGFDESETAKTVTEKVICSKNEVLAPKTVVSYRKKVQTNPEP